MDDEVRWKRAEELLIDGHACIRNKDFDGAIAIADELRGLRNSGAFEIAAMAHAGRGDIKQAITVLEEGVERAPAAWLNWQLLGNYQSDLGQHAEAEAAYERALECPNVWGASVRLNQAILANRRGDHSAALARTSSVGDPDLALQILAVRMAALIGLGRADEAEQTGMDALSRLGDKSAGPQLAGVAANIVRLRLNRGDDKAQLRKFALSHWELDVASASLLAAIRDIDGTYSADALYYRVLVHGNLLRRGASQPDAAGFFSTFDVVASDPEECLAYIGALDTREPKANLTLEEIQVVEPRPNDPKGVYWCSGRAYYKND